MNEENLVEKQNPKLFRKVLKELELEENYDSPTCMCNDRANEHDKKTGKCLIEGCCCKRFQDEWG